MHLMFVIRKEWVERELILLQNSILRTGDNDRKRTFDWVGFHEVVKIFIHSWIWVRFSKFHCFSRIKHKVVPKTCVV